MSLKAPIRAGIETSRSESTINTKFTLTSLNVVSNSLKLIEGINLFSRLYLCILKLSVLLKQSFIVNQAVSFHCVWNTNNLISVLKSNILVLKLLVKLRILKICSVILPRCISNRTIHLEECRGFITLADFTLKRLLICARSSVLDLYRNTSLLGIFLSNFLPLISRFWLEVKEVNLTLIGRIRRAGTTCSERTECHRGASYKCNC
ncbi:Uncharacterised protein [Chlamydia trachomatis]|nr:Uncharacterised protein [Chlamydia trachomatis]